MYVEQHIKTEGRQRVGVIRYSSNGKKKIVAKQKKQKGDDELGCQHSSMLIGEDTKRPPRPIPCSIALATCREGVRRKEKLSQEEKKRGNKSRTHNKNIKYLQHLGRALLEQVPLLDAAGGCAGIVHVVHSPHLEEEKKGGKKRPKGGRSKKGSRSENKLTTASTNRTRGTVCDTR